MKYAVNCLLSLVLLLLLPAGFRTAGPGESPDWFRDMDWGFFAHQQINRLAVFTLPQPLGGYFKQHLDYLSEHAVDPDKRRYAVPGEAERHYIDLDHYGSFPFASLPREYEQARAAFLELKLITPSGDTLDLISPQTCSRELGMMWFVEGPLAHQKKPWPQQKFTETVRTCFVSRKGKLKAPSCKKLRAIFELPDSLPCAKVLLRSPLDEHGILPYHLLKAYRKLVRAFESGEEKRILKQAADIGHYIADAHVPLHTTENYNGQLTGQEGIHAFWESRLPELFAGEYDFFVGAARYIEDPAGFFWQAVLDSHLLVDSVLQLEMALRWQYPESERYCYEERGAVNLRTTCRAYAESYHHALNGMVERRMRQAIRAVGSIWYSAYLDAAANKEAQSQ